MAVFLPPSSYCRSMTDHKDSATNRWNSFVTDTAASPVCLTAVVYRASSCPVFCTQAWSSELCACVYTHWQYCVDVLSWFYCLTQVPVGLMDTPQPLSNQPLNMLPRYHCEVEFRGGKNSEKKRCWLMRKVCCSIYLWQSFVVCQTWL